MKFKVNAVIQALSLAAQVINFSGGAVQDDQVRFWLAVGLSAIQGATGVLAHFANPDGTSARAAWRK